MTTTLRTIDTDRWFRRLLALALACALCLVTTTPALADFESAVAAYEAGRYQEAQVEFEALAAAGDERAQPYLARIRNNLRGDQQDEEAASPTIMDSLTSIFAEMDSPFAESDTANDSPKSSAIVTDAGPSTAARPQESASRGKPADWEPWSPFDENEKATPPPPQPVSDVVAPERRSIWSSVFHLPGDATVVGLQYVAQFLSADNLSRELQIMSRHSDKITLSILAGFWWLVIVRIMVGIGVITGRLMKAAATIEGQKRYG